MDRSGRRTAVIAWAITAAAMFGGAAATAAPAIADDRGTDASGNVDGGPESQPPARGSGQATPPARVGRGPGPPVPPPPPHPCPWPVPAPSVASAAPARNSQIGIVIGVPNMPSVAPVPIFGDGRGIGESLGDSDISIGIPALPPPDSSRVGGPASAPPDVPSALVAPSPVVPPAVPVVDASPAGPPARSLPNLPAPGRVGPMPVAPAARPSAPQLPEPQTYLPELRPDDLGRIASTALPGVAALVGMTLLGGAIGYRQARAGYLLRAAGAGRFLR